MAKSGALLDLEQQMERAMNEVEDGDEEKKIKDSLAATEAKLAKVTLELATATEKLKEQDEDAVEHERHYNKLHQLHERLENRAYDLRVQLVKLANDNKARETELDDITAELFLAEDRIGVVEKKNAALVNKLDKAKAQLQKMKKGASIVLPPKPDKPRNPQTGCKHWSQRPDGQDPAEDGTTFRQQSEEVQARYVRLYKQEKEAFAGLIRRYRDELRVYNGTVAAMLRAARLQIAATTANVPVNKDKKEEKPKKKKEN